MIKEWKLDNFKSIDKEKDLWNGGTGTCFTNNRSQQ